MPGLFPSLRGYRRQWLGRDALAGVTVWAVLVPEALAYATIAGVSPVVGLYAAPVALILYAAFGSSRHLVVGPMAATAALSAAIVGEAARGSSADVRTAMTAALAVTVGIAALLAGLLRLGFLAGFISEPVLKGFIVGLALTIIAGQLPKLFGVEAAPGDFFEKVWALLGALGGTSGLTLVVGAGSLLLILVLKRVAPFLPGSLLAVALGIAAAAAFDLEDHGVAVVGGIATGLPSFGFPDVSVDDLGGLAAGSVGVLLVAFAEGLGAAKSYAARDHYEVDADRELIGLGAAGLGAGLSSGMVVNGSLSKTAVNWSAGARTQLSGVFTALLTVITLLFFTGLFEKLPEAVLAGVVIAAVAGLVDVPSLAALYRVSTRRPGRAYGIAARPDFVTAVAAMLGVMVFDTLPGLFIGIGASLLLLLYRSSRPVISELGQLPGNGHFAALDRHTDGRRIPGVIVLRVEAGIYFANAERIRSTVRSAVGREGATAVVIDAETVPFVDVSAVRMLDEMAEELETRGVRLLLAGDVGQVRDVLRTAEARPELRHVHPTVQAAVDAARTGT
ncbi:SulP family inorganic anion transporter [Actinomadura bangladeshensis]|uniref:SulP family inorganic anion transporter n=1 Tax=Actinomadura bangladeshensis TaxID=453573 RepID=A0A4R4PBK8_9ACTN|nr:SulP family inorganic anion transporter [Actinomadura bangladeshensis]TDC19918.1 SulP family inorganic anion transporter [Actinomadura bangladeshensis]